MISFKRNVPNLVVLLLMFAIPGTAGAVDYLFSISNDRCVLDIVDPADGSIEAVKVMQSPGVNFFCGQFGNGLAADPSTGDLWAIVQLTSQSARRLYRIDPDDGAMTLIGNTGDRFSAIAFNGDGSTLYGVTGIGATTPETLHTLNKTNATPTQVCTLANGDRGKALAFNTTDSLLYHGTTTNSNTHLLEKVTSFGPGACGVTNVGFSGDTSFFEPTALGYAGSNLFYMSSFEELFSVTDAGAATFIGDIADFDISKGLAITAATLNFADVSVNATCRRSRKSELAETITVFNGGATTANDVVVTIQPLSSTTFVSDDLSGACSSSNGVITCNVGDLGSISGLSFTINYTVGHKRNSNVTHQIRVSSDEWETFSDSFDNFSNISDKCTGPS